MRPALSAAGLRNGRPTGSDFLPYLLLMMTVSACGGGTVDPRSTTPAPSAVQTSSIEGDWTLSRTLVTCASFSDGCASTPIKIRFDKCADVQCTISRSDGVWQSAHSITRQGSTWTANVQDIGVACHGRKNTASIVIQFTVESTDVDGGLPRAKTISGLYAFEAATNPPNCADNAQASYRFSGVRS